MPVATVNDVELNYLLEGDGEKTIVLVNGLADSLETWVLQMGDFLAAGLRVLRFDNRGIGASSKPAGPYSSRMLADDTKALADSLGITGFHLMGVSMGGMIAQEYALAYPADLRSVTFACTYAAPGPFCSRMFAMRADMAPVLGVPFVMRDVTLWAFPLPFFEQRGAELAEFETAMRYMDQPVHAYLAQLALIQQHDTTDRLSGITTPTLIMAGEEDILIPVSLSRRIHEGIPGSEWATTKGGHGCVWEHPAEFNRTYLAFIERYRKVPVPESFITYITRAIGTRVAVAVGVITILGYIIAFGGICIFVGSYIVQNVFGNSHIWGLTQLTTIVYGVLVVAPVVAGLRWPPTPTRSTPRRRPSSRSSRRSSPGSSCPA